MIELVDALIAVSEWMQQHPLASVLCIPVACWLACLEIAYLDRGSRNRNVPAIWERK